MLVHLTAEERRDLTRRYRTAFPEADVMFLHEVPSRNGQPFRLDDVVSFRKRGQPTLLEEGVIGLFLSMSDENLRRCTYAVVLCHDDRLGRRQFRVPITDVSRPTQ